MVRRTAIWLMRPLAILMLALIFWLSLQMTASVQAKSVVEDTKTLLIQFDENVTAQERDAVIRELNGQLVRWLAPISVAQVALPDQSSLERSAGTLLASYQRSGAIESVEYDGPVFGTAIQEASVQADLDAPSWMLSPLPLNDPDFNDPQLVYAPQLLQLPTAWNYTMGDPDVVVAVVDSGINPAHPEFQDRVIPGYDFVNNDDDPADDHGHGTHVAGIIAAAANNGTGMVGVCPQCRLLPVKVLNEDNVGTWAGVAAGVIYAVDNGADIINLSLGGNGGANVLEQAIEYANQQGVLVVAAAGNGRSDAPFYPAAYPGVLGVSASRNDDTRWSLSNFGDYIDLAAPGYAIYSTYSDLANYYGGYTFMSGTSMASPHVAGVAALLLSQDPERSAADVERLLLETAKDLGDPGKDAYFGYGRVDPLAALSAEPLPEFSVATLGGRVWQDTNQDGVQGEEEAQGVPGLTIQLLDPQGQVVDSTSSDEQGNWSISGFFAGDFTVKVVSTTAPIQATPEQYSIQVGSGDTIDTLDFGIVEAAGETGSQHQLYIPIVVRQ